jgi:hypothetical protein
MTKPDPYELLAKAERRHQNLRHWYYHRARELDRAKIRKELGGKGREALNIVARMVGEGKDRADIRAEIVRLIAELDQLSRIDNARP